MKPRKCHKCGGNIINGWVEGVILFAALGLLFWALVMEIALTRHIERTLRRAAPDITAPAPDSTRLIGTDKTIKEIMPWNRTEEK